MASQLFSDGETYEWLMGRWSRLVGKAFLAWLDTPKDLQWLFEWLWRMSAIGP